MANESNKRTRTSFRSGAIDAPSQQQTTAEDFSLHNLYMSTSYEGASEPLSHEVGPTLKDSTDNTTTEYDDQESAIQETSKSSRSEAAVTYSSTIKDKENQPASVLMKYQRETDREYVSIPNDTYDMFFLSGNFSQPFFYSIYVFLLKMALFTFLAIDSIETLASGTITDDPKVLAGQFLMLPVAVAMQEDLTATFFLISNIKYCRSILNENPNASRKKYCMAVAARAIDGAYSLLVNYVVLLSADSTLTLFLNFAALQFLQTIDDIAVDLAAQGFLSDQLETVASKVVEAELPKRSAENWLRTMDTILFAGTVFILLIEWIVLVVTR